MASSYESTPETTNTNRVSRAFLGPCTDGLRDILRHYIPPSTFFHVIKVNKKNIPRLTADQRNLILPQHGSYAGNYSDMDISLLYILLRNITSGIPPHSNGWGNDPDPSDRSLSANIERVRLIRNKCYGHSTGASMSYTEFLSIWSDIRSVMVDVDVFLNNGNTYQMAVDFLRSASMDPDLDQHYENELRKQVEEDRTTRKMVANLDKKLEEETKTLRGRVDETTKIVGQLDDKVEKLTVSVIPPNVRDTVEKLTESVIPPNVRDQHNIDIQKWRDEDKLYYETHSFPSVMERVRNHPCVTFVGGSGSGKSATAHHIALKLQEEGYEVVPVDEIREIKQYCDTKNPQVFVIDDVVGVFGLQKTKLDVLTDYEQKITKPCMVKSRTLMTCREAVFNETLPYKPFLTKEETVIRLNSSDHELDDNDKKQILQKYGLNKDLMSPALLKLTSRMFPLLCKLFSKETKFQALGYKFFLNPAQCIIDELDNMQKHNKLNYATLVLCVLNESSLSKDILKDRKKKDMAIDTLENCRLKSSTDTFEFMDALSAMQGTYTEQNGAQYTFIHDSMFEICAYHYGKQFPDQMLLYMSSSYIANSIKPQTSEPGIVPIVKEKQSDSQSSKGDKSSNDSDGKKESDDKSNEREKSFDLCVRLREDQYPLLAERLYRDIQNMELYDVFRNPILKHPQVCQAFIGVLETKSYRELKSLFLSSHGEVDKIGSKRECVEKESEERRERGEWRRQEVLVDQRWKRDDKGYRIGLTWNVRVISWVIYYGHHQIIEYIIQQTAQHNQTSELCEITGNSPHQSKFQIFRKRKNIISNRKQKKVERYRLLLLSCYSGDVQTVRVLLPVCKDAINWRVQISEDIDLCYDTPLTAACKGGHVDIVKELLKAGADVNLQEYSIQGNTPLITACEGGHASVVEELVKVGAYVNLQGRLRNTPLIAACVGGHVDIVKELLKAGADVNLQDRWGYTPLIAACEGGHVDIVKELVKAGADVNLQDRLGNTPLIAACEGGHVDIVKELLKAGADVNLQNNTIRGITPLIAACERGHVDIVKELLKVGTDVNLHDDDRYTPLIAACRRGHVDIVKELLKVGTDVNLHDDDWYTPLIAACGGGHVDIVKKLLKAGADVNLRDRRGDTPLIAACERGRVDIVKELVKAGADVNLRDRRGGTPLIAAYERGHVSVVEELVKAMADVNLQDKNTPLIAACEGGHVDIVKELLKAGADVDLQVNSIWGNTPLITAAYERGHVDIVKELIKAGADVNLQGIRRYTLLITAVQQGSLSTVKCLVEHGADWVTQVVDFNSSVVYRALILNKPDIAKYLIQQQNKIIPGQLTGNEHLFNCLVEIRHAGVKTDSRDDVVVTDRSAWCMDRGGGLWRTISEGDCDVLRDLLCGGLDVNQSIQWYSKYSDDKSDVRHLLYTLIDGELWYVKHRTEKVSILLRAGADVNIRVRYREYGSVLDREDVSVLERTRRWVCEYSESKDSHDRKYKLPKYKEVMCEIKKHVRRHSV